MTKHAVRMTIAGESFDTELQENLAPRSCALLERLLPYRGKLIHAQWSGQACWSPLSGIWPAGSILASEDATSYPAPGHILIYGGELSEPELLVAYGPTRFASKAGPLAGNTVLVIDSGRERLADLGRRILWGGAVDLHLERFQRGEAR